jgi:hypothetical protein
MAGSGNPQAAAKLVVGREFLKNDARSALLLEAVARLSCSPLA